MWNLKHHTSECTCKTERVTDTDSELVVIKGEREEKEPISSVGLTDKNYCVSNRSATRAYCTAKGITAVIL